MSDIQLDLQEKQHVSLLARIHRGARKELQKIKDPADLSKDHEAKSEKAERGTDHLLILAEYAELLGSRHEQQKVEGNGRSSEDGQYTKDKDSGALLLARVGSEEVLQGRIRLSKIKRLARLKNVPAVVEWQKDSDLSGENDGVVGRKEAIKISGQQKEEKIRSLCAVASQQQAEFCEAPFPCFGQPMLEEAILYTPGELRKEQHQISYPVMLHSSNDWIHGYCKQLYYPLNQVLVPTEVSNGQIRIPDSSWLKPSDGSRVIAQQSRLRRSLKRRKQIQKTHIVANDDIPMHKLRPQLVLHMPSYGLSAQGSKLPAYMGREVSQIVSRGDRVQQIPRQRVSESDYQVLNGRRHADNGALEADGEQKRKSLVKAYIGTEKTRSHSKRIRLTQIKREARLKSLENETNLVVAAARR